LNGLLELPERLLEVELLRCQELEALLLLRKFFGCREVHLAHAFLQALELVEAGARLVGRELPLVVIAEHATELEAVALPYALDQVLGLDAELASPHFQVSDHLAALLDPPAPPAQRPRGA